MFLTKLNLLFQDKRSHCVNEILETERNYVKHLEMVQHKFIDNLRGNLAEKDIRAVFSNLEVSIY